MRLDKYLKVSRIIKRRTIANQLCDAGKVLVNDKIARASYNVKINDIIKISLGDHDTKVEVISITPAIKKEEAQSMYRIISSN